MFETDDEYSRAIRGASIHALEEESSSVSIVKSLVITGVIASVAYFGFNYYNTLAEDNSQERLLQIKSSNPTAVMGATYSAEDDYIAALNNIKVEPLVEVASHESLTKAISSIVENAILETDSEYTQELIKEIED